MRIAVTGSTGLVGRALVLALEARGDTVFPVRRPGQPGGGLSWSPGEGAMLEPADGGGLDAVVHLAGAPIAAKRWNASYKQELVDSRVAGTRSLVAGLAALKTPPRVLVSASAIAIYGREAGERVLDESRVTEEDLQADYAGSDFLTGLAHGWEHAAFAARAVGIERVVTLRTGIVLAKDGGALERMLPIFKLGLGARLSSGKQWMSWITLDDMVRAILFALDHETLDGPVNTDAPEPVTNATFTKALGRALRRPTFGFVPRFLLRGLVGEFADAALLVSHRVVPERLLAAGFEFEDPELAGALALVLG